MKNKFEKYLSLLLNEGIKGYNHFRIFEIMNEFFSKEKESYKNSKLFVQMSRRAHLELSLYHLFKIYDTQKKSINIYKFLTEIEDNKNIFENNLNLKGIEDLYKTAEDILNKYSNYYNGAGICFQFAPTQIEEVNTHLEFVEAAYVEERSNRVEKYKSKYIS